MGENTLSPELVRTPRQVNVEKEVKVDPVDIAKKRLSQVRQYFRYSFNVDSLDLTSSIEYIKQMREEMCQNAKELSGSDLELRDEVFEVSGQLKLFQAEATKHIIVKKTIFSGGIYKERDGLDQIKKGVYIHLNGLAAKYGLISKDEIDTPEMPNY